MRVQYYYNVFLMFFRCKMSLKNPKRRNFRKYRVVNRRSTVDESLFEESKAKSGSPSSNDSKQIRIVDRTIIRNLRVKKDDGEEKKNCLVLSRQELERIKKGVKVRIWYRIDGCIHLKMTFQLHSNIQKLIL